VIKMVRIRNGILKCDNCGRVIPRGEKYFSWQGLIGDYCSPGCSAWGCPNAILKCRGEYDGKKREDD